MKLIVDKKETIEELYKAVTAELNQEKNKLGTLRDYAAMMFLFFDTLPQRETFPKELARCKNTMIEILKTYWGESAKIDFDFDSGEIICTSGDGKTIKIKNPAANAIS